MEDIELVHVVAMVDRLCEILKRVRIEAVAAPPAGVVRVQMRTKAPHTRLEGFTGGLMPKTQVDVPQTPQAGNPAVQDMAGRRSRRLLQDGAEGGLADQVSRAVAEQRARGAVGQVGIALLASC